MVMPSSAIYRLDLASTFTEWNAAMNRKGYIAPRILVPRVVGIQSADIGKIPIGQLLQTHSDERASGGGYKRGNFKFDKFNYSCDEHGWEEPLDDRNIKIYADIFDAESIAASRAEDFVMRNYELDVAALIFSTSTFGASYQYPAGGYGKTEAYIDTEAHAKWSAKATCMPIDDVEWARKMVIKNSGLVPNTLAMSRNMFWFAANCDQVIQRLKYSGIDDPKQVTLNAMAEIWQVDNVVVAGGIKNTAQENESGTFTGDWVWSDSYVWLGRTATSDDPREPCVGRTLLWSEDGPGGTGTEEEIAVLMEEYREENRRGSVIRARNNRDLVIMYAAAGGLLTGV